jgi:hypothetical protein
MEPVSRSEEIVDAREQPAALNCIERWTGAISTLMAASNTHRLLGEKLVSQPYPVPALQIGPVLRFNPILEIALQYCTVLRTTCWTIFSNIDGEAQSRARATRRTDPGGAHGGSRNLNSFA